MGGRLIAVGDIHGCLEQLDLLIDGLDLCSGDRIVFLGDYVDRGPNSRGVIDRLLRLRVEHPGCVFLKGNHEAMFLSYLGLPGGSYGDSFLSNGGAATLLSYGLGSTPRSMSLDPIPTDHREFLDGLAMSYRSGRFFCVHAGVSPRVPLDQQSEEDMLWIREKFTERPHSFGCIVVYGHTIYKEVNWVPPYRLGLDTGAVRYGTLTACDLSSGTLYLARRGATEVALQQLSPFEEGLHQA